jgi:hypothetical protein
MLRRIERVMNTLLESQRFNTPTAMKELVFNIDNGPGFFIVQSLGRLSITWLQKCIFAAPKMMFQIPGTWRGEVMIGTIGGGAD